MNTLFFGLVRGLGVDSPSRRPVFSPLWSGGLCSTFVCWKYGMDTCGGLVFVFFVTLCKLQCLRQECKMDCIYVHGRRRLLFFASH